MKKLGFLFTLALIAQSAMAEQVGTHYSAIEVPTMTAVVAETGTSVSWAAQLSNAHASKQNIKELDQKTEQSQLKVNLQLEQRIAAMIETSLQK
ncbi:hypothetical protein FKG94_20605 [Exilibacterium tricleocarpae]|uniref:Uncharacterized protein n=1 Tax=Exilibacterium tricleocarpae TaxID=2591008 RepID=A0A545T0I6_9GAMM|nr:hypothetical protein [Exilibacterium tricleocarpae]TQV70733.1 hypothetical protein FKG94_20605 [Exilibacterium tricleocarpae]